MDSSGRFQAHSLATEINYLKATATAALEETNARHGELQSDIAETSSVMTMLSDLPNKIKHPIMVPFGGAAFFPGHLVHTNEVMVKLGGGFTIECSAMHAQGVMERRITRLEDEMKGVEEDIKTLQSQVEDYNEQESEGMLDIVEEYDEALHGSQPPRFHQGNLGNEPTLHNPPSSTKEVSAMQEETAQDSDEELFSIIDRMAELEAAAEAADKDGSGEQAEQAKGTMLRLDKNNASQHPHEQNRKKQTGLKRGFLLERKVYQEKKPSVASSDTREKRKLPTVPETSHVVERNPNDADDSNIKMASNDLRAQGDDNVAPKRVSKFKQRMMGKRST